MATSFDQNSSFGGQGVLSFDRDERNALANAGFTDCAHPGCGFMHSPGLANSQTCPNCGISPDQASDLTNGMYAMSQVPGGSTRSGLSLREQGDIGENLIQKLGEIPGYGKITWWHDQGGQNYGPLDGATGEWGIEVRSYNVDNSALQFNISPDEKIRKNQAAAEAGYKGILAVVVALDFRRSLADIYVRPFTLEPWGTYRGQPRSGIGFYRPSDKYRLMEEVPFENPWMIPGNDAPYVQQEQEMEPMPF